VGEVNPALLVGLGGVCGALARYRLGARVDARNGDTLAVNLLGSFLLGVLVTVPVDAPLLQFLGTGFCGAFTTFSSFAVETVRLAEAGEPGRALGNAAVNLVGALLAVALGVLLAGVV
jgi:CrcB protein